MFATLWGQRIESDLRRISESDHNTGASYEAVNETSGTDTARLGCHQFQETLTSFQLAYILRGVGFQEIALE